MFYFRVASFTRHGVLALCTCMCSKRLLILGDSEEDEESIETHTREANVASHCSSVSLLMTFQQKLPQENTLFTSVMCWLPAFVYL